MTNSVPAVVLGLSYPSLFIARSLGRKGIRVIGIDKDRRSIGSKSRYVTFVRAADSDVDLLEKLTELSASSGAKPVLFPVSDDHLVFVSRHREQLSRHFCFPYPKEWSLEQLVSKESMREIFHQVGIGTPNSLVLKRDNARELEVAKLEFPVVIKPIRQRSWLGNPEVVGKIGMRKALLVEDRDSLEQYLALLGQYDTMVVQEFVPGGTKNLYYFVGYRNSDGRILISFVGRKLRTFPDLFGSECFSQSIHSQEVRRLGEEVLKKLNYVGPAGIDFKLDNRDHRYKVIEINCRLGLSDGLLMTCGIDVPYLYYRDTQGMGPEPELDYKDNVFWCWLEKEIEWFREYGSRDGFSKVEWCRHFAANRYSYCVFAWDDLKPFGDVMLGLIRRTAGKLVGRSARH